MRVGVPGASAHDAGRMAPLALLQSAPRSQPAAWTGRGLAAGRPLAEDTACGAFEENLHKQIGMCLY